jgi:hypothetical protein
MKEETQRSRGEKKDRRLEPPPFFLSTATSEHHREPLQVSSFSLLVLLGPHPISIILLMNNGE